MRILIIGPAHPLRGGLATFNHRLAKEFKAEGHHCSIVSFSLQYPNFLFPGTTQFSDEPPPQDVQIDTWINSVNPLNWIRVGNRIKRLSPDIIVVRFWLPFMGPALGTIVRIAKKRSKTRVICIADNVIPHEKRPGDTIFTAYFLKVCDGFITMSDKVLADLHTLSPDKPYRLVQHPLYDNFGERIDKETARKKLGLPSQEKIILFFGFIRKYKGLDMLLQAMSHEELRKQNIKLLIAGEFYEDAGIYNKLIQDLNLTDQLIMRTNFIPDSEVSYYLCAADCVIQPYRSATQSGVTPLAYYFEKPMIVTNVGGLPALVPDHKAGLVCMPDPDSIAASILEYYSLGEKNFIPHLREEKKKYSWGNLTRAIVSLAIKS